jgi:lipoprotein-releasing system permease protein
MAIGFVIGALGTVVGLLLGFVFLYFRQPIVHLVEIVTGQNLWDPRSASSPNCPAAAIRWKSR